MKSFPHEYPADASSAPDGPITVSSRDLPTLLSAAPREFDGPGDQWSPETLLVAAVADCFILTFRAIARYGKLEWIHLECHADGVLDRVEKKPQFTKMTVRARLTVPQGTDVERARALLVRAEENCLVTNSLKGEVTFEADVVVE